jgi:succinate dehydrogenase / fumarate reductase cytochrome b subunit
MAEATHADPLIGHLVRFGATSIGSKVIMAITGAGIWLFTVAHLAGNLSVYLGHDTFNSYAMILHEKPALLYFVRTMLIIGVPLHIITAARTTMLNRAARPTPYAYANNSPARIASKSMMLTGALVLVFFCYHLAHFTLHLTGPMPAQNDPYTMLVMGFQNPLIAIFYILAQVLLAAHLSHGLYSLSQHFGFWGTTWTPLVKNAALVIGYGFSAAFASIPLAVLFGFVK